MNSQKHEHRVEFGAGRSSYFYQGRTPLTANMIKYGDQEMWWPQYIPLFRNARRNRKIKRIILHHNKQSVKAGKKQERIQNTLIPNYTDLSEKYSKKGWV